MPRIALLAIALCTLFPACARRADRAGASLGPDGKPVPTVAVSILPQRYFVERIGGERVKALVLVGPGQNPHSYEPTPQQMTELSRAACWILSGTDFERSLVPKVREIAPNLTIVDGVDGVAFRHLEEHHHEDEGEKHADGPEGIERDTHTWLGREPAKILAAHVASALSAADPAGSSAYEAARDSLIADIDRVFDGLKGRLAPLGGTSVFVFHPSFGYFLDEFAIEQEAVETGGKEPSARVLAELIAEAKEDRPRAIFVQAQFPTGAARTVADAIGAEVVPLDPLAPDWLENISRIGEALARAARETP